MEYEHKRLGLEIFFQNCVYFVLGLVNLCRIVNLDLFSRVRCPLDPTSNGMFLQMNPASCISDDSEVYLSYFLRLAVSKLPGFSKHTVSSKSVYF